MNFANHSWKYVRNFDIFDLKVLMCLPLSPLSLSIINDQLAITWSKILFPYTTYTTLSYYAHIFIATSTTVTIAKGTVWGREVAKY